MNGEIMLCAKSVVNDSSADCYFKCSKPFWLQYLGIWSICSLLSANVRL